MKSLGRSLIAFIFIFAVCFFTQAVFAQEKEQEQKTPQKTEQKKGQTSSHNLEEITVTGNKTKEPVTSPYAVTESSQLQTDVWTAEEIEALHPETVFDVLRQVPGMDVTFQGRQHMDFSNMRGNGSYGVILDGVYVTQLDRILATLPVDAIESMTIVRDSTALTLGPLTSFGTTTGDSNQGFVIIKTKRASKLEGGTVDSYGSFHTQKEHLYLGDKTGNFDYRIAGTENSTLGKTNWYNASRNESLLFRGGYTRPDLEADILYYSSRGMREFQRSETVAPTAITKAGKIVGYDWSQVGQLSNSKWKVDPLISDMFAANVSKHWNNANTTTVNYGYNSYIVTSMTANFPDGKGQTVSFADQDSRGQTLSIRHVITAHNNVLKLGGQWNDYVAPNGSAPTTGYRTIDEDMYGLYIQDEYRMLNDRLTFDAGIRGDKKHDSNNTSTAAKVVGNRVDEWTQPVYAFTLGTAFKLIPKITLTGRYSYTENDQSNNQMSATGGKLPTEVRSRYEGGILANIHPSFNPWLTVYYYDTANQKTLTGAYIIDPATGDELDYVTASNVITRGAEFGVSGQILKPLTYRVQYTYIMTNDHATNNSTPHNNASGTLSYKYKKFDVNTSFRHVSTYSHAAYDERGGYTMWDGNVAYNCKIFDRDTRITFYVRNIGDKAYLTSGNGDYYDPGRQYGIQLSYSFF